MQKRRDKVALISCNGFLYAFGGHESSTIDKSIVRHDDGERYDPKSNQWTVIASFSRPKEALGAALINENIYIIGGFDDKILNEMEKYNTETDKWRKVIALPNFSSFNLCHCSVLHWSVNDPVPVLSIYLIPSIENSPLIL